MKTDIILLHRSLGDCELIGKKHTEGAGSPAFVVRTNGVVRTILGEKQYWHGSAKELKAVWEAASQFQPDKKKKVAALEPEMEQPEEGAAA